MEMLKLFVKDLEGPMLRAALATALDLKFTIVPPAYSVGNRILIEGGREYFRPDVHWPQGGPLIDTHWREATAWLIDQFGPNWRDEIDGLPGSILVWFCRAIVGSKFGDVVDVQHLE